MRPCGRSIKMMVILPIFRFVSRYARRLSMVEPGVQERQRMRRTYFSRDTATPHPSVLHGSPRPADVE